MKTWSYGVADGPAAGEGLTRLAAIRAAKRMAAERNQTWSAWPSGGGKNLYYEPRKRRNRSASKQALHAKLKRVEKKLHAVNKRRMVLDSRYLKAQSEARSLQSKIDVLTGEFNRLAYEEGQLRSQISSLA